MSIVMVVRTALASAVAALFAESPAWAAMTYYVAPGGNDGQSGAVTAPFATIQHAADVVAAGDTVVVRDGTYTDTNGDGTVVKLSRGGTAAAWVIFRAEHRGAAIVEGKNNLSRFCWVIGGAANYVVVDGFDVTGCGTGFLSGEGAHNVTIRGNEIHHIGRQCTETTDGQSGADQLGNTTDHTYDGNVFHHIGRLHAKDGCSYSAGYVGDFNHDHGVYLQNNTNTRFINNVFYALDSGWGIQVYTHWDEGDLVSRVANTLVANNTFADPNPGAPGHIILSGSVSSTVIENNLFYAPKTGAVATYGPCVSNVSISSNVTSAGAVLANGTCAYAMTNNRVGTDPRFVDAATRDYHLLPGSPAIDTGLTVAEVTTDFDGTARPSGVGYDIGAFEYVAPAQDGGPAQDGSADAAPSDASEPPADAGSSPSDASAEPGSTGCGCTNAGARPDLAIPWVLLLLGGAWSHRRRKDAAERKG